MEKLGKIVNEWFSKANEDLRAAEVLFNLDAGKFLSTIPYHSQQAVEKSIKGYLAYKKIKFEKTHDIGKLALLVLQEHPELSEILKEADELTDYAVRFRYPDAAVKDDPSITEVQSSILIARKVFQKMASLIPFEPSLA